MILNTINHNDMPQYNTAISGKIEHHKTLLEQPLDNQKLYKIISIENFSRSFEKNYLHFQRVDTFRDFPLADQYDGQQLPRDREGNRQSTFEKTPSHTAEDYYNTSRERTYAFCLSRENSPYIWKNYGNTPNDEGGKIALVFEFGKLRNMINDVMKNAIENDLLYYNEKRCTQIFDLNYGNIKYVDANSHSENQGCLPNPIKYIYLKNSRYQDEKEFRVSLSASGMMTPIMSDGTPFKFLDSLPLRFDFREALKRGVLVEIIVDNEATLKILCAQLKGKGIDLEII